jgi:hypothetical protein
MDKDLRAALRRRDESETAIIIPLGQSAFDAHMKGLTIALSGAVKRTALNRVRVERAVRRVLHGMFTSA